MGRRAVAWGAVFGLVIAGYGVSQTWDRGTWDEPGSVVSGPSDGQGTETVAVLGSSTASLRAGEGLRVVCFFSTKGIDDFPPTRVRMTRPVPPGLERRMALRQLPEPCAEQLRRMPSGTTPP